jgi:hypothetical protein
VSNTRATQSDLQKTDHCQKSHQKDDQRGEGL